MRNSLPWAAIAVVLGAAQLLAAEMHKARGLVLAVDRENHALSVSCEAIPGYMDAMEMSFRVRDASALATVKVGTTIDFEIVGRGKAVYADQIHASNAASHEPEPMEAGALTVLSRAMKPATAGRIVAEGQRVPDFALTDQAGQKVDLAQFQGKVVALTFGYSRCPNPQYCFRMSNNLAHVERRLRARHEKDLVLMTIMIDPDHDQGKALAEYADTWKADPRDWHFLTGPLDQIHQIAGMFGMDFWNNDGLLTHSLHTVIIDREGRLAANIEGNQFTAEELGDLVETVLKRPS
jgi:protein SCO1